MKRALSATVAVATAAATVALAAPAGAATLSRSAQGGVCQVALTPQEKAAAVQAEASAKTLTLGMQDGVFAQAYEAAIPGLKKLGDAYVSNQNVKVFLRDQREARPSDPAVIAAKDAAWAAQRVRITELGLDATDAGNYLDKKQFSLIPERQYSTRLVSGADAFTELLTRGNPGPFDPTYTPGTAGAELARETKLSGAQRDAFVAAVDRSYYGQTMNALVSAYNPAFKATVDCAPANVAFPTAITLPAPQFAKDTDLNSIAQDPSLSKTGTPADAGSAVGDNPVAAIVAVVIGVIAMGVGLLAQTLPNIFSQLNLPF